MGVDMRIAGTIGAGTPAEAAKRITAFFGCVRDELGYAKVYGPVEEAGRAVVAIGAHPATPAIHVDVQAPGRLVLGASTGAGGPGYHQWVCALADRMGRELGVAWIDGHGADGPNEDDERTHDDTGYWRNRDRAELERSMLGWLRLNGGVMRDGEAWAGADRGFIWLSMAPGLTFEHELPVITPTGPRTREWLTRVGQDPASGIDFFPWWDEGVTARVLLNRALVHMWCDAGWAAPGSYAQGAIEQHVMVLLERAHAMDPTLEYPWREWAYLFDLYDAKGDLRWLVRAKAARASGGLIGYRRNDVTHLIGGGWQVRLPGKLTPAPDDVQDPALDFCVAGGGMMITIRSYVVQDLAGPGARVLPPSKFDGPGAPTGAPITAEIPGGVARGIISEQKSKSGATVWGLFGEVRVPGAYANVAARFLREDRAFADELLKRFTPPASLTPKS